MNSQILNKCVPIWYKSRMIHLDGFFSALLIFLAIIFLVSCTDPVEVAMKTTDLQKGRVAVNKLTDQMVLKKVALEAVLPYVRVAAIRKLTDQSVLTKIATDRTEHVAVCIAATEKLTDPAILAKVALEEGWFAAQYAVEKLPDPAILVKLGKRKDDRRVQLIYKLMLAFDSIPDNHRSRIINKILPAIILLDNNEVINIVGEIVSIRIDWSPRKEYYGTNNNVRYDLAINRKLEGESIECSIELDNLSRPLSHRWSSNFPNSVSINQTIKFEDAQINIVELLVPVFEQLPQSVLTKIAVDRTEGSSVRIAAVEKLIDQSVLGKIAADKAADISVRRTAIRRLTDQSVLTKIAANSDDNHLIVSIQFRLRDLRKTERK